MKNPIQPSGFFKTPDDVEDLQSWINSCSKYEQQIAIIAAGMAWNLASKLVNESLELEEKYQETRLKGEV